MGQASVPLSSIALSDVSPTPKEAPEMTIGVKPGALVAAPPEVAQLCPAKISSVGGEPPTVEETANSSLDGKLSSIRCC